MFTNPAMNTAKFANPFNNIGYNYNVGGAIGQYPFVNNPYLANSSFAIPGLGNGIVWTLNLIALPNALGVPCLWQNGQNVVATNNLGHTLYGQLIIDNFGTKLFTPYGVYSILNCATHTPLFLNTLGCQTNSLCGVTLVPCAPIGG